MKEEWLDIKDYEGLYKISNLGRVFSIRTNKILKLVVNKGYYCAHLHNNNILKVKLVHRLVAQAFIPNPNNYPILNHKDENRLNNIVSNLEWCDYSYNNTYNNLPQRQLEIKKKRKTNNSEKPILQYDLNGNFIREFKSLSEAERILGYPRGNITSCLKGRYKYAYRYIWKYKDE